MGNRAPTILLVDDEADHRVTTGMLLSAEGIEVREAASGEEAVTTVSKDQPDLILLDFHMGGMNGYETLLELRKQFDDQQLPILMLSGHQDPDTIANALDNGANDYISKAVHPKVLLARVRRHLHNISLKSQDEPSLGEFKIQRCLGRGTVSTTFLLEHPTHQKAVVAKLLKPGFTLDEKILGSLERVEHNGVSNVTSWKTDPVYVLTEYLEGVLLQEYLQQRSLDEDKALKLMIGLAQLVKAVHETGTIHGAISPENILVNISHRPQLLNIGITRAIVQENEVTPSDFRLRNQAFESPESVVSGPDIRSDLYSLGAVYRFLLTEEIARFDALVVRLMDRDPNARHQDTDELLMDLEALL